MISASRLLLAAGLAASVGLVGCGGQTPTATVASATTAASADVSSAVTYTNAALSVAEAALAAYEATKNPSQAVITEATKLDGEAKAAVAKYGPEASETVTLVGSLATYLLTAAPGNGVTPAAVPAG